MTFHDLGLIAPILSALDDQGYVSPSPIQEKAIPPALQGRDVLGCAQTGTGKTCAFAAPILQRLNARQNKEHQIRTLILTPTRELAIQIGENMEQYGKNLPLRSTVIFGGVGQGPQVERIKKGVDILTATPGRLADLHQQKLLDLSHIEIFVLDEADRMLDMGFIHDVKKILKWLPEKKQTMLFSATMPNEIAKLVDSLLRDPVRVAVNPVSSPVEAIKQSVYFVDRNNKTALLAHLVREKEVRNALVFTRTKHGANKVARDLGKEGITAAAIHGNKSQTARQQALADFKSGSIQCLVATDIAARGLDIEELSHVFNYNLPEVPETYVHRIGRTGRAGRGGEAIAFCDFGEKPLLKEIEKLMGRTIPVCSNHPFPMIILEAPKRDKHGRIINAEDDEARAAAKALRQERAAAAKAKEEEPAQIAPAQEKDEEEKPARSRRRRSRKPAQAQKAVEFEERELVEDILPERHHQKLTRPGTRIDTGDAMPQTDFERPDPLAGDHIMDATARLLAPRRSSFASEYPSYGERERTSHKRKKPARHESVREEGQGHEKAKAIKEARHSAEAQAEKLTKSPKPAHSGKSKKAKGAKPAVQNAERAGKPAKKQARPAQSKTGGEKRRSGSRFGGNRRGMPMEPQKSGQTKDSTEQQSLMKPYYLHF